MLCIVVLLVIGGLLNLALLAMLGFGPTHAGPATIASSGDVDGSGAVDISDTVYLLQYLFSGGPAPVACAGGPGLTAEQAEILSHLSIEYLDDGAGGTNKSIRFSEVNLQVVSGLGATNGHPSDPNLTSGLTATNGLGNLIIGYDENNGTLAKVGSHNLVVGSYSTYESFGGAVLGANNSIQGPYCVVSGGIANTAKGLHCSVTGGSENLADGVGASVTGGALNIANGLVPSVHGGLSNESIGQNSTIGRGEPQHSDRRERFD